jgi:hypothetical protein
MHVITNIEYSERPRVGRHGDAEPHKSLVFSVSMPDDRPVRFLVDKQAIRMLDAPAAKAALLRRSVEKIVVRAHSDKAFSVDCFVRGGLAQSVQSRCLAILEGQSRAYSEEIGVALEGFDAQQVAGWLRDLGYTVDHIAAPLKREAAPH